MLGERRSEGKAAVGDRLIVMRWVAREVISHESSLRSWLRRFTYSDDIDDIVQESYSRIANLKDVSHIRSGRAYLFTTARMIVAEKARRAKVVRLETVARIEDVGAEYDSPSPEQAALANDYLYKVRSLIDVLPERCRDVFRLRKIEGLSQREVAEKLGISEHTVENDVGKGLSLIMKALTEGEQRAELSLESIYRHETTALSAHNR
jgi:RNA polymerase sigma-70 factor (ECF subfamily)